MMKKDFVHYQWPKIFVLKICIVLAFFMYMIKGNKSQDTITIGFMGDVMIGRSINKIIDMKGYSYIWGNMLPLLKQNDLNIINLESTLTYSDEQVPKVFNFKASPEKVKSLALAHITVANIANNHTLDFNISGLKDTIEALDKALIFHVGAGMNEVEARKPLIISKNGIKIGIIGYTDNEPSWAAIGDKPGINFIKIGNIDKVNEDISDLRDKVDLLIASIHWGPNWKEKPSKEFIDFAHAIIDLGVDILHGHSAHNVQGIENYKNKLIMYQTGDFIDDYAVDPIRRNDRSFLFQVNATKNGVESVKLVPTIISNMQVNTLDSKESANALHHLQMLSEEFNTKITEDGSILIN